MELGVVAMRPYVPAKQFETSLQFYTDLGFSSRRLGEGLASMHLGPFAFILQDFYVKDWADNFMMHLLVQNVETWWAHISGLDLAERYNVKAPAEPKRQSWGLTVGYVWDPSGVLWHIAKEPGHVAKEPGETEPQTA